jgi:predicted DCC family thiol-disulfide oxidoreductase YuxK
VLYNADCGFCSWSVDQLRRMDRRGRLEYVPLQHAPAHPERPELAALAATRDLHEVIHVIRPDGGVRAGGGAMLEILDALPGGWLLRPWALAPGVERVVDLGYRSVARRRGLFSAALNRRGANVAACDLHVARGLPATVDRRRR